MKYITGTIYCSNKHKVPKNIPKQFHQEYIKDKTMLIGSARWDTQEEVIKDIASQGKYHYCKLCNDMQPIIVNAKTIEWEIHD